MSYSNGLLNYKSSGSGTSRGQRGLPGVGFKLTASGDYDMENKQLKNLKNPTDNQDACTKAYTDDHLHTDGTRPMSGNLDMQNNKIINVADPTNNKDVVNLQKLNSVVVNKANKTDVLLLDGSQAMTGNLNVGNKKEIFACK